MYDDVEKALRRHGWLVAPYKDANCQFVWAVDDRKVAYSDMPAGVFFNHFEGNRCITTKVQYCMGEGVDTTSYRLMTDTGIGSIGVCCLPCMCDADVAVSNPRQSGLAKTKQLLPGVAFENSDAFFPRCYDLNNTSGVQEFRTDFCATAAVAVLRRHVRYAQQVAQPSSRRRRRPVERVDVIRMAVRVCEDRVRVLRGECAGVDFTPVAVTERQWEVLRV